MEGSPSSLSLPILRPVVLPGPSPALSLSTPRKTTETAARATESDESGAESTVVDRNGGGGSGGHDDKNSVKGENGSDGELDREVGATGKSSGSGLIGIQSNGAKIDGVGGVPSSVHLATFAAGAAAATTVAWESSEREAKDVSGKDAISVARKESREWSEGDGDGDEEDNADGDKDGDEEGDGAGGRGEGREGEEGSWWWSWTWGALPVRCVCLHFSCFIFQYGDNCTTARVCLFFG